MRTAGKYRKFGGQVERGEVEGGWGWVGDADDETDDDDDDKKRDKRR